MIVIDSFYFEAFFLFSGECEVALFLEFNALPYILLIKLIPWAAILVLCGGGSWEMFCWGAEQLYCF